ncbi:hypothetical protein [Roseateles amylovorans]|uniref:Uncharacterized protein n=1 Tax=Roseateles amylovorans TaxID=2978473 RepID=A0ABY6B6F0_9BURK|nr:hypothetical protein [Roseateles amylovorans]UXH79521.1 hypothetical protein N4261_06250 [Roseateles amylovorans]
MSVNDPLSSFVNDFAHKHATFDKDIQESLSLEGPSGQRFVETVQSMQREMLAVQISLRTRHGLLKKVMNELR